MFVSEVMRTEVRTVGLHTTMLAASDKMVDAEVDSKFVTRDGEVVGVVTGSDLASCVSQGHRPHDCLVFRHMSLEVRTVHASMAIADAAQIMLTARMNHLPVVGVGRLVGEISMADIVQAAMEKPASENGASFKSLAG